MGHAAFPDWHRTIEDIIAEGDKVVIRFTFRATHKGEYQGVPATGKQVKETGILIFRIASGKIVEVWEEADELGFMRQLGAIPAAE
jgi:predicted ester cyclase